VNSARQLTLGTMALDVLFAILNRFEKLSSFRGGRFGKVLNFSK